MDPGGDGGTGGSEPSPQGSPLEVAGASSAQVAAGRTARAPAAQEWADVLNVEDDELIPQQRVCKGQASQVTDEVLQREDDPSKFEVDGKDKSWFMQKGGMMFRSENHERFQLKLMFFGDEVNRYGDDYADLSRAEQHATMNWMVMAGVAPRECKLTGYKDCKAAGFFFLFHINYRRTAWRVIGCPHSCLLEDGEGKRYTCNPQEAGQLELPAAEGQALVVEYGDRELRILDAAGLVVARGRWESGTEGGKLPDAEYHPVVLTPNCPTRLQVTVE